MIWYLREKKNTAGTWASCASNLALLLLEEEEEEEGEEGRRGWGAL